MSLCGKTRSLVYRIAMRYTCNISPILLDLINSPIREIVFPAPLKLARVVPIHKTGSKINVLFQILILLEKSFLRTNLSFTLLNSLTNKIFSILINFFFAKRESISIFHWIDN